MFIEQETNFVVRWVYGCK